MIGVQPYGIGSDPTLTDAEVSQRNDVMFALFLLGLGYVLTMMVVLDDHRHHHRKKGTL